jgi:hypothetical protein
MGPGVKFFLQKTEALQGELLQRMELKQIGLLKARLVLQSMLQRAQEALRLVALQQTVRDERESQRQYQILEQLMVVER